MDPEKVEGDIFDSNGDRDDQNVIVDCDVLEAAKENIQPIAGGRRATALAAVLATPHGRRDARLVQTKALMRERVEDARKHWESLSSQLHNDEGSQSHEGKMEEMEEMELAEELLLDSYVRLVNWTIEHYPQGHSAESGILELIEESTRVLRKSQLAKGDARYLNLWIRYASYVEKPEVIYEYILANEIGTDWAKLYEEYALVLERLGRWGRKLLSLRWRYLSVLKYRRTKADEIYLLGIARKAQPLDHLERRHQDFQKRMMVATPISSPEIDSSSAIALSANGQIAPTAPRRRVLGESTSSSSTPFASSSSSRRTVLTPSSVTGADDVFSTPSTSTPGSSRANGRLAIFVDPTGEGAEQASGNPWPELGTRKERIKENVRAPEKMNGAILKQRGAAKAATKDVERKARAAPKIVPFRDPEPMSNPSSKGLPPKTPGKTTFKPFVDEISEETQACSTNYVSLSKAPGLAVPATPRFVPFRDEVYHEASFVGITTNNFVLDFDAHTSWHFLSDTPYTRHRHASQSSWRHGHIFLCQRSRGFEKGSL